MVKDLMGNHILQDKNFNIWYFIQQWPPSPLTTPSPRSQIYFLQVNYRNHPPKDKKTFQTIKLQTSGGIMDWWNVSEIIQ